LFHITYLIVCKRLMCLQVVSEGDFIQVTKSNVLLRGLGDDDFEDWKVLWRKYLDFYETHLPVMCLQVVSDVQSDVQVR